MVAPQYAVVAVAVGVVCAIAYNLYTTLSSQRPQRQAQNQRRRSPEPRRRRPNPRIQCEICKRPVLCSVHLACGHEYHKPCLLSLDETGRTIPDVCVSCWVPFSNIERQKIITMDTEVCTICLFAVESDSFILDCGHEFHRKCAQQMLNHEERRCPNCRDHLSTNDLRRLASGNF